MSRSLRLEGAQEVTLPGNRSVCCLHQETYKWAFGGFKAIESHKAEGLESQPGWRESCWKPEGHYGFPDLSQCQQGQDLAVLKLLEGQNSQAKCWVSISITIEHMNTQMSNQIVPDRNLPSYKRTRHGVKVSGFPKGFA